jgi:hypothetical protein
MTSQFYNFYQNLDPDYDFVKYRRERKLEIGIGCIDYLTKIHRSIGTGQGLGFSINKPPFNSLKIINLDFEVQH